MALSGVETGGRLRRIVLGTSGTIAGTVYGTIVVMGVVTAGAGGARGPWELIAIVVSTVLVLWIAHVYAHGLGEAIGRGRRLDRAEFVSVARRGARDPTGRRRADGRARTRRLRAVRGRDGLSGSPWRSGSSRSPSRERATRLSRGSGRLGTVESIGLNLAFGLVIVALKALVGH